jgi:hypothetical protein
MTRRKDVGDGDDKKEKTACRVGIVPQQGQQGWI